MTAATRSLDGPTAVPGASPTDVVRWLRRGLMHLLVPAIAVAAIQFVVAQDGLLSAQAVKGYRDRYGSGSMGRLRDWEQMMLGYRDAGEREKIQRVNDFFNTLPWVWDHEHWNKRDYWATPLEMLGTNGGDCEDFSIAKYISLVRMGVAVEKLRIIYVRAPALSVPHMVLAYYPSPNAVPLILDNMDKEIRPATQRSDLIPVYSFNAGGLWASVGGRPERKMGGASKLNAWRDVSRRMREQGLESGY